MTVSTGIFRLSFDRGRSVHAIARVDVRHGRSRHRPGARRVASTQRRLAAANVAEIAHGAPRVDAEVHLRVRSTRVSTVRRIRAGSTSAQHGVRSGLRGFAPSAVRLRRSRRWFPDLRSAVFESLCTRTVPSSPCVAANAAASSNTLRRRFSFHAARAGVPSGSDPVPGRRRRRPEPGSGRGRGSSSSEEESGDDLHRARATIPDELSAREEFTSQARARCYCHAPGGGYSARRVRPRSRRARRLPPSSDALDWNRSRWTSARVALPGRMGRAGSTDSRGTTRVSQLPARKR